MKSRPSATAGDIAMRLTLMLLLVSLHNHVLLAADWPAFRGPRGDGISQDSGFPTEWSRTRNVKWRAPLPGPDNGSPIVVGDKVIVLCGENEGKIRSTYCFDRKTGNQLWKQTVEYNKVEETHKTNPWCPTTPASDGKRIAVWHRSAGMHCYDLDGHLLWSRDLGEFHHIWGGGSSPIFHKNLVIQLCGPGERTFVTALNQETGKTVWQTETEPGGSASDKGRYVGTWSTPVLIDVSGQTQLLVPFHKRVVALNPENGEELWSVQGLSHKKGDLIYTSPMVSGEVAVVMGGFNGPGFAFKLGGTGDVTEINRLWHSGESATPQRIGSGIILDGKLFMPNADNPGSLECLDIHDGTRLWQVPRTKSGPHWGSMVASGDTLYVTGQSGVTQVLKANPARYELIAENDLGEPSNSSPALSDGQIFLRTFAALYCIEESAP